MNVDVLLKDDIYIKKGPDTYHVTSDAKDLLHDLEARSSKSFGAKEQLDEFKKIISNEGQDDYSGCKNFWVPFVDDKGINMVEQTKYHLTPALQRSFKSKELINKSFIRLSDFLDNSRYVGRYFKRTSPVLNTNDKSYSKEDEKALVLYANDELMLVRNKSSFFDEGSFEMISPFYLKDNNFEFYGEQNKDYMDKSLLCQAIVQQITDYNKVKNKK